MHSLRWLGLSLFVPPILFACVGDAPVITNGGNDASVAHDAPVSGESGADVGTSPDAGWSPATLDSANQLALWLVGSNVSLSNGKVGVWPDQSKNHNDATNAQGGPVADPGVANNHDAVHFVNAALKVKDSPTLQFGIGQFYIATIVKVSSTPSFIFSKAKSGMNGGGTTYVTGLEFFATTSGGKDDAGAPIQNRTISAHIDPQGGNLVAWGDPVFNDSKFHYVALRRVNANTLQLEVDDQAPRSTNMTGSFDVSQATVDVTIGEVIYGTVALSVDFEMAELVVLHDTMGVVIDNDVLSLHTYLKKKYAL